MMKRVAIIGLGTIANKYLPVIQAQGNLDIVAYCDIKDTVLKQSLLSENLYLNYMNIPLDNLDYVFVLTSPITHFTIAKYFLDNNISVFVEKPGTTTIEELQSLIKIAQKNNKIFDVILHWKYGKELNYARQYFTKDIKIIQVQVFDPYYDGTIHSDKVSLGGAWMDSGINVLSMLSLFYNLENMNFIQVTAKVESSTALDYETHVDLKHDNTQIMIDLIWNPYKNYKSTELTYIDGTKVIIDHTNQSILKNKYIIENSINKDRLTTHYSNFFSALEDYKVDYCILIRLHRLVFQIKKEISSH